jgi:DNA-binding beta-propeller fold protein YncE
VHSKEVLSISKMINRFMPRISVFRAKVIALIILGINSAAGSLNALYAAGPVTPPMFRIESQWNLGGAGGWGDPLLDSATHSLYIPRTDRVMVVDIETGKESAEVTGFVGVRNIALDDDGRFGYVTDLTDGTAGFVRVFDRTSLKIVASVPVGLNPDAVAFEPTTKTVFVFSTSARNASILDTATNHVVATIALPARPSSAVADGRGAVLVAMPGLGQIIRIDAAARKISASWSLAPCVGPRGLAIDRADRQLFAVCENRKLIALNVNNGRVVFFREVAEGTGELRFDSRHQLLFLTSGSGTLTIFRGRAGGFIKLQELNTLPGAQALVISPEETKAYLVTAKFGQRTGNTSEELRYRPTPVVGSFTVLVVGHRLAPP